MVIVLIFKKKFVRYTLDFEFIIKFFFLEIILIVSGFFFCLKIN
jgi:hypothetical protein